MAIDVKVPAMGESVVEGTIGTWHKQPGDRVERDDVLVEILTDKVTVEVPSAFSGTITEIRVQEGDVVQVGQVMAVMEREGEKPGASGASRAKKSASKPSAAPVAPKPAGPAPSPAASSGVKTGADDNGGAGRVRTSPAVRRLAREHGIDLQQVAATGPKGRIRKSDLEAFLQGGMPPAVTPAAPQAPTRTIPTAAVAGEEAVETQPFTGVRKMIADHMVASKRTSPHVMTMDEADMTRLVEFRARHRERIQKEYGVKLTYMPFFIKAVTSALKSYPRLNASLTDTEIVLRKYYHIGVAVARDEGLIVPVIRHADTKSVLQLAAELEDLADRARRDALTPDDVSGGTFTLTNAGMFGALASTPVINQPQVAILGIHAIQKRPVVRDDQIVARNMMSLTVSFDHRLIDGHTAVQFLRNVCQNLEEPAHMLLV